MASDHGFGVRGETLANRNDGCTRCTAFPDFPGTAREFPGMRLANVPRRCSPAPPSPGRSRWRSCWARRSRVRQVAAARRRGRGAAGDDVAGTGALAASGLATKNTTRLGGADPIADAAAVALAVNPGLTPATRPAAVVLVDARNWTAALAASALASAPLGAPLLYSEGDTLPAISGRRWRR